MWTGVRPATVRLRTGPADSQVGGGRAQCPVCTCVGSGRKLVAVLMRVEVFLLLSPWPFNLGPPRLVELQKRSCGTRMRGCLGEK